jgi:hypothetical protein
MQCVVYWTFISGAKMGLFGRNDGDNYRAVWHDLDARINGYKLHMPYKWETLSDNYIMYNKDGVTYVMALIKSPVG